MYIYVTAQFGKFSQVSLHSVINGAAQALSLERFVM